jgi:hypothetical protein
MESYTLPTSLRSTFSNTYNLKYTYFGNGDGQPTYENMTSLLRELSSQHTQCMSSCNAACASECAPVYKNDDDVPEDVVMRAETVASTVTAFVAVALAVGIASAVGMGMVGGGASGAASSGAGALPLLAQAQFMSIGAKAGGSTAHPSRYFFCHSALSGEMLVGTRCRSEHLCSSSSISKSSRRRIVDACCRVSYFYDLRFRDLFVARAD